MNGPIKRSGLQVVAAAPTFATVGTSSAQVVPANAIRQGLVFVNTNAAGTIYLGLGVPAVVGSGLALAPGSAWNINEFEYWPGAVFAIGTAPGLNLAIQEFSSL